MATAPRRVAENEPILLRAQAGGIVTLTLNRPRQFNALSEAMLAALTAGLEEIGVSWCCEPAEQWDPDVSEEPRPVAPD